MTTDKHLMELGFVKQSKGVWYYSQMDMYADLNRGYWLTLVDMKPLFISLQLYRK